MWPNADASLSIPCRTPRPKTGEHPRTYQARLWYALMVCEARRKGWEERDASLRDLFTGQADGD